MEIFLVIDPFHFVLFSFFFSAKTHCRKRCAEEKNSRFGTTESRTRRGKCGNCVRNFRLYKVFDLVCCCFASFQAAVEARVLVFEVAERHDMIVRLKNEINDIEQQLKQKDTHIQFKDEIIKKLRQQRRSYLKVSAIHARCVVLPFFLFGLSAYLSFYKCCLFISLTLFALFSVLLSPIFIDHFVVIRCLYVLRVNVVIIVG